MPLTTPQPARGLRWSDVTAEIAATVAKIDAVTAEPEPPTHDDNARILEIADELDDAGTPDEQLVANDMRQAVADTTRPSYLTRWTRRWLR